MSTKDDPIIAEWDVCGAEADGCICFLRPHSEDTVHQCRIWHLNSVCGSAWFGQWGTGTFEPVRYPGGEPA